MLRRLLPRPAATAATLGLLVLAWLLLPPSLGGATTSTIVSGESMEPRYRTGDLVIARAGTPQVGDVVVYEVPDQRSYRVIHRIVGGDGEAGWLLQGDNNDFLDPWRPTDDDVLGIARVRVPHLGGVLHATGSPLIWGSFLLLAAALVVWPPTLRDEGVLARQAPAGARP